MKYMKGVIGSLHKHTSKSVNTKRMVCDICLDQTRLTQDELLAYNLRCVPRLNRKTSGTGSNGKDEGFQVCVNRQLPTVIVVDMSLMRGQEFEFGARIDISLRRSTSTELQVKPSLADRGRHSQRSDKITLKKW
ncbi:hypothetical protein RUM43_009327 [Polyplax serrata]|uniref:Uncharacterized protein n=1 Tax=Polyplax serrata TaxID=468196 RepID=A0AAN8NV91_POLSC